MTVLPVAPDRVRPAMDDASTATAFDTYRGRARRMAVGGLVAMITSFVLIGIAPTEAAQALAGVVFAVAPVICGFGVAKWIRARKARAVLSVEPWVARMASFRMGASTGPALVIHADDYGPEAVCAPMQNKFKEPILEQGDRLPVWVAGDPTRWAVVAPADRQAFLVATRPVLAWTTKRLRRAATTEAPPPLLTRPDDTRPMWRRFASTPFGWVFLAQFVVFFAVFFHIAGSSTMGRDVTLRMGGLFALFGVGIRVSLGRRLCEAGRDETKQRAALFVLTVPMLGFALAITAAGLTSLLLHL